jgi:integrase
MPKFNLYLDDKQVNGRHGIKLYVRGVPKGNKRPIVIRLGESIEAKHWDKKLQRVKPSYIGSPELNRLLERYRNDAESTVRMIIAQAENTNDVALFDEAQAALNNLFTPKKQHDFFAVYDEYLALSSQTWQQNTLKKFKTLRKYLHTFSEKYSYSLTFQSINADFADRFRLFLLNDVGILDNSAYRVFTMIKTFMAWSERRNYHKTQHYKQFKVPTHKIEVIYLNLQELFKLYNYDFSNTPRLERVRDVFCFQCFTGQRFSDVQQFRHDAVVDGFWKLRTIKTRDNLTVALNRFAQEIAEKYRALGRLPVISIQNTNYYLKECCEKAGIDSPVSIVRYQGKRRIERTEPKYNLITTHSARRTFVSVSIALGVPIDSIRKQTGHTSERMVQRYDGTDIEAVALPLSTAWNALKQHT